jgi:integrase
MSVQFDPARSRWVVRWSQDRRQRTRRFTTEAEARRFDAERKLDAARARRQDALEVADELRTLRSRMLALEASLDDAVAQDGVYPYATRAGVRWRLVCRPRGLPLTTRRGFRTRDAALAARHELLRPPPDREPATPKTTFAELWEQVVTDKRAQLTPGAFEDLVTHGRKRLLPFFANDPVDAIDELRVREWMAALSADQAKRRPSAETINNARIYLAVALNEAVRHGLIPRNPCEAVRPLRTGHAELDYLRIAEIEPYLDACAPHYRPLAQLLIGTGARISEAIALTWNDVDLKRAQVYIARQRARHGTTRTATIGKRTRSVDRPRTPRLLQELRATRTCQGIDDGGWLFLCPRPRRGRYAHRTAPVPPSRKTVHEWHEGALHRAGLRDMPLHALRHTAAATWLSTGHPLIFVAHQLGHRSITTTEDHFLSCDREQEPLLLPSLQEWLPEGHSGVVRARCGRGFDLLHASE